ncbi:hypothetical protein AMAG_15633 [Allomyces macrogynus ATCC 38327]|uniref:Mid2 domain-containing protein n=1 Tax=Allomyces macrogynus (strain ATCC 38327) TaxID=578462 RepID=A0A0L0T9B3_ALLM3|nr:hypothetical protein AMAG_15633 [Allomyces macrogynus ATCC 38327]|eukprot:KNE71398.1 hypothetical protein AMAG_15633 [Allomyces macrogynus ATCC 38327]
MLALLLLAVATAAAASAGPAAGDSSSLRRRAPQVVNIPGGVDGIISSLLPTATAKPAPASSSAVAKGTPAPTATGTSKPGSGTTIKSVVTVTAAPTSTAATAVTITTSLGSTATATPTPTADAGFFSKITGNPTILYSVIGGGAAILLGGAVAAYCCCCRKKRDSFTSDVGAAPPSHYGGSDVGLRHAASEVGTRAAPGAPYGAGYGTPPPQMQHGPRGYPPRQQLQPHGDGGGSDVGSNLSVQSAGGGMRRVPSRGEGGQYNPRQRSPSPMRMAPSGAGRPGY